MHDSEVLRARERQTQNTTQNHFRSNQNVSVEFPALAVLSVGSHCCPVEDTVTGKSANNQVCRL